MKSEGAMSETLKKVAEEHGDKDIRSRLRKVGSAFLKNREVSAQEATFRLLSIPLKRASRLVVFINTGTKENRISLLKPQSVLQEMDDDDENIFCNSLHDRYAARPHLLDTMSLAEFAATYYTGSRSSAGSVDTVDHLPTVQGEEDDNDINLEAENSHPSIIYLVNALGSMKKRKRMSIIRFHKPKTGDEMFRCMLMLFYPWRDESLDLKGDAPTFEGKYYQVKNVVDANEAMFCVNGNEVDEAYDNLQQNGPPDDAWDVIAPNIGFEQAEQVCEGFVEERQLPEEDIVENIDIVSNHVQNHPQSDVLARFSEEMDKALMSPAEYAQMVRCLNSKQRQFLNFHKNWCDQTISALNNGQPLPQYCVFLSGPGGVGKSHIIKLVYYETVTKLKKLSGHFHPNEIPILLTAFTGTAAFGIEGLTLHSALGFVCGPKSKKEYQPAGSSKLNTLRSRLGKLRILVIDEVSMVGADLLYHIHRRLEEITENTDPDLRFGGVSILAVGDLYQLQPVAAKHVFGLPSDTYAKLHGSLWEENFKIIELTESMRQKGDQHFANLLMRVRTAQCNRDDLATLQSRIISRADNEYPYEALHVFKTKNEVDNHNRNCLLKLKSPVFVIKAIDKKKDVHTGLIDVIISTKPCDTGGLREIVSVAVGARVMITVNVDVTDGLANGVCGTVVGIDHSGDVVNTVFVLFDSSRVGVQAVSKSPYTNSYPTAVPIKRQEVQFYAGKSPVMARRSQFPISLAWGCTIHKVQGKTLETVVVSMEGKSRFMPGQAYVALSRVREMNGLYLLGFDEKAIKVDKAVIEEMKRIPQLEMPPS